MGNNIRNRPISGLDSFHASLQSIVPTPTRRDAVWHNTQPNKKAEGVIIPLLHRNVVFRIDKSVFILATGLGTFYKIKMGCITKLFVCLFALRPMSTAMVIAGRSVHLTTLFPGQA